MPNERNPLLDIDEDRLDQEWIGHMRLAMEMIEAEADARKELSELKAQAEVSKDELKKVKAELYLQMRATPSEFDLPEKPSETTLESAVLTNSRYKDALNACYRIGTWIVESQHKFDLCQGRVYVCRDRKEALQDLVKLHLTGFHSEPRADTAPSREYTSEAVKDAVRKPLPRETPTASAKKGSRK